MSAFGWFALALAALVLLLIFGGSFVSTVVDFLCCLADLLAIPRKK